MVAAIAGRLRRMGLPTDAIVGIQLPNIGRKYSDDPRRAARRHDRRAAAAAVAARRRRRGARTRSAARR